MYYNDISAYVIKEAQIQAKWQTDDERRKLAEFANDLYNGLYHDYLDRKIIDSVSAQGDQGELLKTKDSDNLVKNIIDDISLIFAEKPEISILNNDKVNEVKTDALKGIFGSTDFYVTLTEINRLTNLFQDMPAVPVTRNGRIEIDLITPDRCFVDCDPLDPTEAETFYYQIDSLKAMNDTTRVDLYIACRKDGREIVQVRNKNGKRIIEPYTGEKYKDFIDNTQYKYNPVVTFRNYKAIDSYWHEGVNALIEKSLNHDMRLTEYELARIYQMPILFSKGLPDDEKITVGRKSRINIPPDYGNNSGDVAYRVPDQRLSELGDQLDRTVNNLKLSYHMSKSVITGETATSGYQLWLSKAELLNWNKAQRKYYYEPLKRLISNIMAMSSNYADLPNFPGENVIDIKFGEQKFVETPEERIRRQNQEVLSGTKNLVDIEMENSGLEDRDVALEIVKKRIIEKRELDGLNAPIFEIEEE